MGQHVLFGRSQPSAVDDRGLVAMQATDDPKFTCLVRYSYIRGGDAAVECSDGARFHVPYQGMSPNSGSGRTTVGGMVVSICYGMTPKTAIRHLAAPAGYALAVDNDRLILTPN